MKNYFCTLFDHRYLDRGIALHESISFFCKDFLFFILCMNDEAYNKLSIMNMDNIHLVKIGEIEIFDKDLLRVKQNRSKVEYYFTCKSSLLLFILKKFNFVDQIAYLDADIYFYSSPELLHKSIGDKSIGITPHRFENTMIHLEKYGKYNAGILVFKNDKYGFECLSWWHKKCIEWCHDYVDGEKFADQKYIDKFPDLFEQVVSIENVGINLAPWNISGRDVSYIKGSLYVGKERVVCYHFHNLRSISKRIFDLGWSNYTSSIDKNIVRHVYRPYVSLLAKKRKYISIDIPLNREDDKKKIKNQYGDKKTLLDRINFFIFMVHEIKNGRYIMK